jgi:hypothetical protein
MFRKVFIDKSDLDANALRWEAHGPVRTPVLADGKEQVMAETAEQSTKMQIRRLLKTRGEAGGQKDRRGVRPYYYGGSPASVLGVRAAGLIQVVTERRPKGRRTNAPANY